MKGIYKDLTGLVCGELTVIELDGIRGTKKRRYWKCLCSCGNTSYVRSDAFTGGNKINSCGCVNRERSRQFYLKKGHNKSRRAVEYNSWDGMHQRCYNPKNKRYPSYGGRGIIVCDRWKGTGGFINFIADMGKKPTLKHSLDRIDVNGNYEPSNCRWATNTEQNRNKRENVKFEYEGKLYLMDELALKLGTTYNKVRYHLQDCGRSIEELLMRKDVNEANRIRYRTQKCNVWLKYNGERLILNDWAKVFKVTQAAIRWHLKTKSFEEIYNHYMNNDKRKNYKPRNF